jgi:hypothetical protein
MLEHKHKWNRMNYKYKNKHYILPLQIITF